MAGAAVSASSGAMNSVIAKLASLLTDEYTHLKGVKSGIRWLRDELGSMNAVLQRLGDMDDDQIDVQTKEWRNKVRELSYDIEDCIDRFLQNHSSGDANANLLQKGVRKMKKLWENHQIGDEIKQLKERVIEEKERHERYKIADRLMVAPQHVRLDPRVPALYEQAKNLVGIDKPREQIIGWIKSEEKQLKVVSIFGTGGLGKTTLAMEVYHKIDESFDCRAMVSVSRTPDIKKLLRDILFQINEREYEKSNDWEMEQLIPKLRKNLEDKRYFFIIDDIWSTDAWKQLKSALPANDNKSRIITTTRIRDVAKSCCCDFVGHMYEAMPQSEENSCKLFFRRVFSSEDCPKHLTEAASVILKKCGGLPLAIISIAGLLSNKNPTVEVWTKIKNSISSMVEKDSPVDKMKRILFLSYFDLPQYLKTCLLYLSVFPEDSNIDPRRLIRLWVAEGLILGQSRACTEQSGESYLHELINRSMIQPSKIGADGRVKICRIHDVILDFIVSQAEEENFVTILNNSDPSDYTSNKFRRLSLQSGFSEGSKMPKASKDLSHLRSLHMFKHESLPVVPSEFAKCQVLRVLAIKLRLGDNYIKHVGHFCELKYLRIKGGIHKLPEEIGKLQHLQTLDLAYTRIEKLPASIVQLQKLVHLLIPFGVPLPDEIGNLQALEVLSGIDLDRASVKSIYGLGELSKLRDVRIWWSDSNEDNSKEGHRTACISSLSKLVKCSLQSLRLARGLSNPDVIASLMISCGFIPPLRRLVFYDEFPTIPSQFASLVNLTRLRVEVGGVGGLEILASLPILQSLTLDTNSDVSNLRWQLDVHGGPVVGLHHLSALKSIALVFNCNGAVAAEVESSEDDARAAAVSHPNCPTLDIQRLTVQYAYTNPCN
ncbi:disease resistance protein RGA5-like isoform X5 [Oryza sativa Japonica Group]|uniref:disease resistance protein RGA5-like isoform X5 n=1 Tax=Oryza sativa subsp. japonica TaxID=39947 RepID=UPI00339C0103